MSSPVGARPADELCSAWFLIVLSMPENWRLAPRSAGFRPSAFPTISPIGGSFSMAIT
jgi:hypothetical protein